MMKLKSKYERNYENKEYLLLASMWIITVCVLILFVLNISILLRIILLIFLYVIFKIYRNRTSKSIMQIEIDKSLRLIILIDKSGKEQRIAYNDLKLFREKYNEFRLQYSLSKSILISSKTFPLELIEELKKNDFPKSIKPQNNNVLMNIIELLFN